MSYQNFSVAMSVYNKDNAKFLDRALQSIIEEQSIKPNEIVLVCDGPINNELNGVIEKYKKSVSSFNVIRLAENKGLGNALKIAIDSASNELIARMDSDDVSVPDRFEKQLDFFKDHPEVDIVGGDITEFVGSEDNCVGKRKVPTNDDDIKEYMKKRAAFNHVTVMYKKKAVQDAGGYLDWFCNEDYYLWIRMQLNNAVFANTGTVLVNVRVGEEMYQRRGGRKYFLSEFNIQKLMLKKNIISFPLFIENVGKRMIVQLLLPNRLRGLVFRKYARS